MNKKVLIISFYFPPIQHIGSIRLRGLAKYLPEHNWQPTILTSTLPGKPEKGFRIIQTFYPGDVTIRLKRKLGLRDDKGFKEQIGIPKIFRESNYSIINEMFNIIRSFVAYPDEKKGWYRFALKAGQDLLKREKFHALISSSYPFTCHFIARDLKTQFKLPWIADFRDPWSQNHYCRIGSIIEFFESRLEIKTLSSADALVTVSKPWAEKLRLLHRGKLTASIPNGYDPDEIASTPLSKEFSITYTGSIHQGKRNPIPLFRAVAELISEGKVDRENIKIRFYGGTYNWLEEKIKRFGLKGVCNLSPEVPRNIALEKQRESHLLLILLRNHPKEKDVCPGKTFEYLAAQRPILVIGGVKGVITDLLEETGSGIHARSYQELKQALIQFYEEYKTKGYVSYKGEKEKIAKYSHKEMARNFAELLNSITSS